MPGKWTDLPKDIREAIANELRKFYKKNLMLKTLFILLFTLTATHLNKHLH